MASATSLILTYLPLNYNNGILVKEENRNYVENHNIYMWKHIVTITSKPC